MKSTVQELLDRLKKIADKMIRHYDRAAKNAGIRKKSWNRKKKAK
jgi:hypothetical protein